MRGKSFKYLSALNPKWKSMHDVDRWVYEQGVIEELFLYQMGGEKMQGERKLRDFAKDAAKLMSGKDASWENLKNLGESYQVGKNVINKTAFFMKKPEMILRRDAFMSHLVQAYENFDGVVPIDSPVLLKMAKRGVQGTQFLYSSPYRPMWSNTGLGKVLTRFQLWAWNSTRFRNDIMKGAAEYGYRPGTESFDKYKRFMLADMFMLGLASAFMYSLFESALPQPYAWAQDTADFFFGDDKQRERAFFGAYPYPFQPLQLVTPISMRGVGPTIKALVDGDWTKWSGYTIWTMFPFGRIARDVVGKSGIAQNPSMVFEKMFGIPFHDVSNYLKEEVNVSRPKGILGI